MTWIVASRALRKPDLDDPSVVDAAAVRDRGSCRPPPRRASGSSRIGLATLSSASSSSSESASITQTYGWSRRVRAGVERVGPPAVLLVDDDRLRCRRET